MSQVIEVKQFIKPVFNVPNIPAQIISETTNSYSPGFKSGTRSVHTGLTFEEQAFLLPKVIGVSANSPDFQASVEAYYTEFSRLIPADGVDIDASYAVVDGNRVPVNLDDYLLSKLMTTDMNVANTEEELDNSNFYDFIVVDKNKLEQQEDALREVKKLASINMVALYDEPEKIKYIVTILRKHAKAITTLDTRQVSTDGLTVMEVESMTDSKLESVLSQIKDTVPEKFNKLVKDENLAVKALIAAAVEFNVVTSLNGEFYMEEEKIATSYKTLVATVKKDNAIIALLQEKVGIIKSELGK